MICEALNCELSEILVREDNPIHMTDEFRRAGIKPKDKDKDEDEDEE